MNDAYLIKKEEKKSRREIYEEYLFYRLHFSNETIKSIKFNIDNEEIEMAWEEGNIWMDE